MIEIFEGRIGGGKTYFAVYRIIAHLVAGGTVCTNVDLVWPKIKELAERRFGVVLEDDQLIVIEDEQVYDFHRHTPSGTPDMPVLVVLDEAHIHFNARDFAATDKAHRETLIFLTQSRKVFTDVIFISQSMLNLDKQFARLVQFIWRFRDMAKWTIPGLGIPSPFRGILAVQLDFDGRTVLQRQFVGKDPAIFGCYHTNALVRPFVRLEGLTTKRKLARSKRRSRLGPLVVLAVAFDCLLFLLQVLIK